MEDEHLIRAVIASRTGAMARKDGQAAIEMLSRDIVAFELTGALQAPASQAADDAAMQAWLDSWEGPVETEVRDLQIHVSGEVAFAHSLNRLRARRPNGNATDFWMRSTLGLRKRGDGWEVVHSHTSVPFRTDGSFKAALDLTP